MTNRPKHRSTESQKHLDDNAAEEGEKCPSNGNKRDREGAPVQISVAVTPEARKGTIVSYMSGNTLPATPRRGQGKKESRATEDLEDDIEDKIIQDNFDSIHKAEAAAQRTMEEMGVETERKTGPTKETANSTSKNKKSLIAHRTPHKESITGAPQDKTSQEVPQAEEGGPTNSHPDTNQQQEDHTEGKPSKIMRKRKKSTRRNIKKDRVT